MTDLLSNDRGLERIPIRDGELLFQADVFPESQASKLLITLINETPWRQEELSLWGNARRQPRLIAWYGDQNHTYSYSGITLQPIKWTPVLNEVRTRVEQALPMHHFNSVLLNYYRNGRDSMGFHSDNERELGLRPTIASISLGETRTFVCTPSA